MNREAETEVQQRGVKKFSHSSYPLGLLVFSCLVLWLYCKSRGSAIPISCTVNVVGAIWLGFGSELACPDSG